MARFVRRPFGGRSSGETRFATPRKLTLIFRLQRPLVASDERQIAHVALPATGSGPPVLLIHSWWGLTRSFTAYADRLADRGYVVGCADLFDGRIAASEAEARSLRAARRREPMYKTLQRCVAELSAGGRRRRPLGRTPAVIGFSMDVDRPVELSQHPRHARSGGRYSIMPRGLGTSARQAHPSSPTLPRPTISSRLRLDGTWSARSGALDSTTAHMIIPGQSIGSRNRINLPIIRTWQNSRLSGLSLFSIRCENPDLSGLLVSQAQRSADSGCS